MTKNHQKICNDKDFLKLVYAYHKVKPNHDPQKIIKSWYNEIFLPSSIFVPELGCLEAVVKYLRENLNLKLKDIAAKLQKSEANVRISYSKASKKHLKKFRTINVVDKHRKVTGAIVFVPLNIFVSKLSMLEALVKFLKDDKELKYNEIGKLLGRNQRTIWTVYNRAIKKLNSERKNPHKKNPMRGKKLK
ncbi:hypothetical protein HN695_04510 [Candidatus Woesearchaeota archaeon]|jgi:predicted DNA-binding protein (UPF0251 family)|nr:hypothetical protein [Candidatus Woesearchaeota archaeon]MBT5271838.1 hypothetical protein [Candidatus Woesearchaeota archaeon]MBT6040290.1 hypothetical protein [Candidatus Woesearchaeota archaeon]MBT6337326.1 hypothetical protein [Candidatus Woesearchaeota archaeon]MBT7927574.1 hypothetical protein [Candidatus Woesearchaeota archaeon]